MTRIEAKETIFLAKDIQSGTYFQDDIVDSLWLLRTDVLKFIDKIYDDFEKEIKDKNEKS